MSLNRQKNPNWVLQIVLWLVILICLSGAGFLARQFAQTEAYLNTAEYIFSLKHLSFEIIVFVVSIFLIFEAISGMQKNADKGFMANSPRFMRLTIGIGILAVHITVLLLGGYKL